MNVIGLDHVAATVRNLETSISFYADLLGLDYLGDTLMPSDRVYELFGLQGVSVRYAHFAVGRAGRIELFEFDPADTQVPDYVPARRGPIHFALEVKDLDALYRKLCKSDVEVLVPPKRLQGTRRVAVIRDPDGLVIELIDAGLVPVNRIRLFSSVRGLIERFKRRRRAGVMPTGAYKSSNGN